MAVSYKTSSARQIMDQIRAKILSDIEKNKDAPLTFNPYKANHDCSPQAKAGELLYSEDLKYINEKWAYANKARASVDQLTSHRFGIVGKLIVKLKKKLAVSIWDSILRPYFEEEKEFQSHVVRFLNSVSKYVDHRDASNFWELIRKIDIDITNALERIERVRDEQHGSLRAHEKEEAHTISEIAQELSKIREQIARSNDQISTLDSVARGLESIVARASRKTGSSVIDSDIRFENDQNYLLLENRFRGSEQLISDRVSIYPEIFSSSIQNKDLPILEIGGGRGELQKAFKDSGINSFSVDLDPAMVESSKEKGLDVRLGDGIEFLQNAADSSLSGVIAVQVVEHLNQRQLKTLFTLCKQKVVPGGKVIFETINPRSVVALSSNYFRDPTHVWPLHPDTLSWQMGLYGLKTIEVKYLSEIPEEAGLQEISLGSHMTPMWQETLNIINRNFRRLHLLLYGHQDYCVIAEV